MKPYSLVIHGGAGTILKSDMTPELENAYINGLEDLCLGELTVLIPPSRNHLIVKRALSFILVSRKSKSVLGVPQSMKCGWSELLNQVSILASCIIAFATVFSSMNCNTFWYLWACTALGSLKPNPSCIGLGGFITTRFSMNLQRTMWRKP